MILSHIKTVFPQFPQMFVEQFVFDRDYVWLLNQWRKVSRYDIFIIATISIVFALDKVKVQCPTSCIKLSRTKLLTDKDHQMFNSSRSRGPRGSCPLPPSPVKISHKKDSYQRRPHRFHVSWPSPYPATGSATVHLAQTLWTLQLQSSEPFLTFLIS